MRMAWNNVIPFDFLDGMDAGIWRTTPVADVPEIELRNWKVVEVASSKEGMRNDRHFVGYNITEHEGRVSSKIIHWDRETRTGTTKSGRTYKLLDESYPD